MDTEAQRIGTSIGPAKGFCCLIRWPLGGNSLSLECFRAHSIKPPRPFETGTLLGGPPIGEEHPEFYGDVDRFDGKIRRSPRENDARKRQSASAQLSGAYQSADGAATRRDPNDVSVSSEDPLGDPSQIISEAARDSVEDGSIPPARPPPIELDSSASCAGNSPKHPPPPHVGAELPARRIRTDLPDDVPALAHGTSAPGWEHGELRSRYAAQHSDSSAAQRRQDSVAL